MLYDAEERQDLAKGAKPITQGHTLDGFAHVYLCEVPRYLGLRQAWLCTMVIPILREAEAG